MQIIMWFLVPKMLITFWGIGSLITTIGGFICMGIGGGRWIDPAGESEIIVTQGGKSYRATGQVDLSYWDSVKTVHDRSSLPPEEELERNNSIGECLLSIGGGAVAIGFILAIIGVCIYA